MAGAGGYRISDGRSSSTAQLRTATTGFFTVVVTANSVRSARFSEQPTKVGTTNEESR